MSEILPDGLGPEARCRLVDALRRGADAPSRQSWVADVRVADALAAYLDAPDDDTRAELLRLAPEEGEWLVDLGDCLRAFPRSAWRDVVLRPGDAAASGAPGEPAGTGPAAEGGLGAHRPDRPHAGDPARPRPLSRRQCPPGTWRWRYWPSW